MASGVIIIALAVWMFWRTRREAIPAADHSHGHDHSAEGPHGGQWIATGHGFVEVTVFETNVPPRFRLYFYDSARKPKAAAADTVVLTTIRSGGESQSFAFVPREDYLEAETELPEPHKFEGILEIRHGDHSHEYAFEFSEGDHHHEGLALSDSSYQDAYERAHALDIVRWFGNRNVTTGQIVIFGLTGDLPPCPAAAQAIHVGFCPRSFIQLRTRPHDGRHWNRRGVGRPACLEALQGVRGIRSEGSIFFECAPDLCRTVYRHPRLATLVVTR